MIGIYCRVSTEQQAMEGLSLDIQREKGIKFALTLQEDYKIYEDAGISGGTFEREQFQNLIQDIKQDKINKVYVVSKDRLTRASLGEAIGLRDFFREKKVKLYVDGQLNALESPEDLLQSNILDSIAEFQRLLTRKKSKEGRQKQIDLGENSYCMVYGYDFTVTKNGVKQWYINENEAKLIRYIYQMYFEDLNFDQICKRLIAEGYKTKRKGTWDRGTISNILRRPEYIGLTPNTKGELIESKHYKPIVERDVWEQVQKTIDGKIRFRQGKHFRSASYDLSGILRCGKCGARFFYYSCPGRNGKKREAYNHKQLTPEQCSCTQTPFYVNRTIIEYLMRALFISTFERLDDVRAYMSKLQADLGKDTEEITDSINRVEKQIADLEKQRKRLVDAIKNGVLEAEDVRDEMNKIKQETKQYQDSIANLNHELLVKSAGTNEILHSFSEDIVGQLNSATANQRREMYGKYCKSILMFDYSLQVEYIIGKTLKVDIKNIPEDIMDQMVELKFYDLYPQEQKPEVITLSDAIFASKPKKYYEVYDQIRDTFILHTKGRPKKPRV